MVSRGNEDPGTALRLFEEVLDVADISRVFVSETEVEHPCGTRIGEFEIVRLIAEGGMGRV